MNSSRQNPQPSGAIRRAKLRPERDVTAKTIERQVAIIAVVAVVKCAFLVAVDRVIRGIEIEDDDIALARDRSDATLE
jgi:hypothetical protein